MADLVTLEQAKRHLRLPAVNTPDQDVDLLDKIATATALVLDYVAQRRTDTDSPTWTDTVTGWTEATVPPIIRAAILVETAHLYRFRGDDDVNERDLAYHAHLPPHLLTLTAPAAALLHRYRDPAVS